MNNPREILVTVARRFVGIRETSPNRFPGDAKIWASTSYPDGWKDRAPWCAALLCHVVRLADLESLVLDFPNRPTTPSVAQWRVWARDPRNGVKILQPGDTLLPGDIVSFLPHFSHIGLVAKPGKSSIVTIEGNTNDAGSREGDGCYEKTRSLSICGEFYRLPADALKAA